MLYLVAIHRPNGYDDTTETEEMHRDIDAVNAEMVALGIRKFVGGLAPTREARSIRREGDGAVVVTDGPYLEAKEFVGGFWVLECADMDEAVEWGRKAAAACRAGVEVRPFYGG